MVDALLSLLLVALPWRSLAALAQPQFRQRFLGYKCPDWLHTLTLQDYREPLESPKRRLYHIVLGDVFRVKDQRKSDPLVIPSSGVSACVRFVFTSGA